MGTHSAFKNKLSFIFVRHSRDLAVSGRVGELTNGSVTEEARSEIGLISFLIEKTLPAITHTFTYGETKRPQCILLVEWSVISIMKCDREPLRTFSSLASKIFVSVNDFATTACCPSHCEAEQIGCNLLRSTATRRRLLCQARGAIGAVGNFERCCDSVKRGELSGNEND